MSERLAKRVLADIPVSQLQQLVSGLVNLPKASVAEGGLCGCGCHGDDGNFCGFGCYNANRATVGVVDQANQAGITRAELDDARSKVLQFKDTLLAQARIAGITLR